MKKAIFLDRDGVINQDSPHYIRSINDVIFIPGSIAALAQLTQAGYQIGVATNQSGIARNYYTQQTLHKIHDYICQQVHAAGGEIQAIEFCPHGPDEGCQCRKPKPGLLQALAKRLPCLLSETPFLGDKISDIQAALAAGAIPIFIGKENSDLDLIRQREYPKVPRFDSLAQWVSLKLGSTPLMHSH